MSSEVSGNLQRNDGRGHIATCLNEVDRLSGHSDRLRQFLLAVMISLLGLVAMSTYFSESQSKDIAVRKVYGGTVGSETVRYVSNYMAMVLTASVIGVPLAVWAAQLYLRRFTYRIEDWWWIPVVAVLISLAISLCAVLWQTLRAAHTDPAKALKKE